MRFWCLILLCSVLSLRCFAAEKGQLSFYQQSSVFQLATDQQGFLWSAGQLGLKRFDGFNSIEFNSASAQWTIPFHWVNHIAQRDDGWFLLSTEKRGLWEFNPKTGEHNLVFFIPSNASIYKTVVYKDIYLCATTKGIYRYSTVDKKISVLTTDARFRDLSIFDNHLYANTYNILMRYDLNTFDGVGEKLIDGDQIEVFAEADLLLYSNQSELTIIRPRQVASKVSLPAPLRHISKGQGGSDFWLVSHEQQLLHLELPFNQTPSLQALPEYGLEAVYEDPTRVLWLISSRGVEIYKQQQFDVFPLPDSASYVEMAKAFGQHWLGLRTRGVYTFNQKGYQPVTALNEQLTENAKKFRSIFALGKEVMLVTYDGLWGYDVFSQQVTRYLPELDKPLMLRGRLVNEEIFLASNDLGLLVVDAKTKKIKANYTVASHGISNDEVVDAVAIDNQRIVIATSDGVDIINRQTNQVQSVLRGTTAKFIALHVMNNKIYAGSFGEGLYVFSLDGALINKLYAGSHITEMESFANKLWIGTKQGIYWLDPEQDIPQLLNHSEQLAISGGMYNVDDHGYAVGDSGIIRFPLNQSPNIPFNVQVSSVKVNGQLSLTNAVAIDNEKHTIELQFASLDYHSPELHRFQYQINNQGWQSIDGHQLTLTNLQPGQYLIDIKGTNANGVWQRSKDPFVITVNPEWYWTSYAKFVYGLLAASLFGLMMWWLWLRTRATLHLHQVLKHDLLIKGNAVERVQHSLQRILQLTHTEDANKLQQIQSICEHAQAILQQQHDNDQQLQLGERSLEDALHYLSEYLFENYFIKVKVNYKLAVDFPLEFKLPVYRLIYEAITSAASKARGAKFDMVLSEFNQKLWIHLYSDDDCLLVLNSHGQKNIGLFVFKRILSELNGHCEISPMARGYQAMISINFAHLPATSLNNNLS